MQRYESYKPSGAEWVGNVPSHWDVQPLRAVTALKSDKNRPELPVLSVYREYGVILKDSRDDNHNATSLDTSTYKVVKPGDLVVNKMKAWQGSMGVSVHDGIVSPAYITCATRTDRVRPAYLHYLLRSSPLIGVYNSLSYGVRVGQWDMHYEDFKQIPIPLPPKDEQDRIVAFLDQKTAEIDAAIAKKERLIELLNEQKDVVFDHILYGQGNSELPVDGGGSQFFPTLGEGIELVQLGRVCRKIADGPHFSPPYVDADDGYLFLSAGNIRPSKFLLDDVKYVSERHFFEFCKRVRPEPGDVLYTKGGTTGVAKAVDIDLPFQVWVHIAVLKLRLDLVMPQYLAYALNSSGCYAQSQLFTRGATNKDLGLTRMKNIYLPIRPLSEQAVVVGRLRRLNDQFEKTEASIRTEISMLTNLKTGLVASAVTGEVKV
ncbi:restriction endonuclease subunit S [Paraburkholderia sp. EG286B]|uniref:restriction endonuclease subunit S n=1 Tax=Paraburkholderia sp. EG286B TaxID=3237011 RepID=UPI0034D19A97